MAEEKPLKQSRDVASNPDQALLGKWADGTMPNFEQARSDAVKLDAVLELKNGVLTLNGSALFWTEELEYSRTNWIGWTVDRCDIEFGLSGGELRVALADATAPSEGRYSPELPETIELEVATEAQRGTESSATGGLEIGKDPKFSLGGSGKRSASDTAKAQVRATSAVIAAGGPDNFPGWKFTSHQEGLVLWGRAPKKGVSLATLVPTGANVTALAGFIIHRRDVKCVSITPIGKKNRVKAAVVQQAFPEFLFKTWQAADRRKIGLALVRTSLHVGSAGGGSEDRRAG